MSRFKKSFFFMRKTMICRAWRLLIHIKLHRIAWPLMIMIFLFAAFGHGFYHGSVRGLSVHPRDCLTAFQLLLGDPKALPGQMGYIVPPTSSGFASVGHAWYTSQEASKQDAEPLSWLLSTRRSSGCTPSSLRMTELLTLSLRLSPATPISFRVLAISLTFHSSWP